MAVNIVVNGIVGYQEKRRDCFVVNTLSSDENECHLLRRVHHISEFLLFLELLTNMIIAYPSCCCLLVALGFTVHKPIDSKKVII